MTNISAVPDRFFSYRTLLGCLAGTLAVLIFTIFFNQPGAYTPVISLMLAIKISKLSAPKHLAGLGALIGIPASIAAGIQLALQNPEQVDGVVVWILVAYCLVNLIMVFWTAYYIFMGFLFAQLIRLYKRGSIF